MDYITRLLEEILQNQQYLISLIETKYANDELNEIERELKEKEKE